MSDWQSVFWMRVKRARLARLVVLAVLAMAVWGRALVGLAALNVGNLALSRALLRDDRAAADTAVSWLTLAGERYGRGEAYRNLTVLWLDWQEPAEAILTGQRALELSPHDPLTAYWLGQAYWAAGRKDAARGVWRASGAIQRKLDYLGWLCWHYVGQDDLSAAEAALREAIDLDPEYGPAYDALASLMWGRDWEKVSWALERAIAYLPEGTVGWQWNVGRLYLQKGDWERAAQALRASVEMSPGEWPMRFLAEALQRAGHDEEAARVQAEIERRWGQ